MDDTLVIDAEANIRRVSKPVETFQAALLPCPCGVATLIKPGRWECCECGQTHHYVT